MEMLTLFELALMNSSPFLDSDNFTMDSFTMDSFTTNVPESKSVNILLICLIVFVCVLIVTIPAIYICVKLKNKIETSESTPMSA
jgi:uncharacterized membrane protein YhaH (DUF805 family)